jgi:hypothetical protein
MPVERYFTRPVYHVCAIAQMRYAYWEGEGITESCSPGMLVPPHRYKQRRDWALRLPFRGAPQDGLLHACNGASSDSSVGAGSQAIGIAFFVEEASLSPFLRTRFRHRDTQKNSSRARKGVTPDATNWSIYQTSQFMEEGGLMDLNGVNNARPYRRAATYVDNILKGAKSTDLPEQLAKFELVAI